MRTTITIPTRIRLPRLPRLPRRLVLRIPSVSDLRGLTSFFFLATLFCCTFEKLHWAFGGAIALSDFLAILFIACYALLSSLRVARTTATLFGFFTLFGLIYLVGYFNIDTPAGPGQFYKGFIKFLIHFTFLALSVSWLARRGPDYYWRALTWFFGGMVANAAYGIIQLVFALVGFNLDSVLISPITGGASKINIYGAVNHQDVYRPNALTGDPNHLGIMLLLPLLVLTPIYLRTKASDPLRRRLSAVLAFLFLIEISTLSRSAILGLALGLVILAVQYSHHLFSRALLRPLKIVAGIVVVAIALRAHYFWVVIKSRVQTGHASTSAHFQVYSFVPQILHSHPLFGLGLNNFSIYYQAATGKTNWGPHSFYVSLIVETGLVGTVAFGLFLLWSFARLASGIRIGRALVRASDPLGARVRPLAWGWTAALAATMAANAFYLTMTFYYFFVFLGLALAVPVVFGAERRVAARAARVVPAPAG